MGVLRYKGLFGAGEIPISKASNMTAEKAVAIYLVFDIC